MKTRQAVKWFDFRVTGVLGLLIAWALTSGPGCDGSSSDWGSDDSTSGQEDAWWIEDDDPIDRGASENDRTTGRQDRGQNPGGGTVVEDPDPEEENPIWTYLLHYSDLVLSPNGDNLLVNVPKPGPHSGFEEAGMVLAVQPLPVGNAHFMPQLQDIRRVNFSPDGKFAYLLAEGGDRVHELDLTNYVPSGEFLLPGPYSVVDVTGDGRYLIASNLPTTPEATESYNPYLDSCGATISGLGSGASYCKIGFVDLLTGASWELELPHRIQDVDFDVDGGTVLISYSVRKGGADASTQSFVVFYVPEQGSVSAKLHFENCADELVISPAAKMALQSPTACTQPAEFDPQDPVADKEGTWGGQQPFKDPISIIDLTTREFVTNLPGFGPVALNKAGDLAAGFTLRQVMVDEWGYEDQVDPVGIILVSLPSLDWVVVDVGSAVPAYTFSPDGNYLYVYNDNPLGDNKLGRIDTTTFKLSWLAGPSIDLDAFVWTPGGSDLITISGNGLYRVRGQTGAIEAISIPVKADLINIRPQGDFILVGPDDAPRFHLMPVPEDETVLNVTSEFDLQLGGAQ